MLILGLNITAAGDQALVSRRNRVAFAGVLPLRERGSGEAVVLLHAGVGDGRMWSEQLEWLAESGFHAVAPDLPGFGEAPVTPGLQAPWEDVLGTMRQAGLGPAVLVGNSFGAAVALRIAVVAPAAVTALVLVSPPPVGADPSPQLEAAWAAETEALERGDIDAAVSAVTDAWVQPQAPAAVRELVATMQRRALEVQMAAPEPEEAPDPLERDPDAVSRLPMPVCTMAGDGDMPDFTLEAQRIAAAVPDGRFVSLDGAGHLAPLETPVQFRDALLRFLRR